MLYIYAPPGQEPTYPYSLTDLRMSRRDVSWPADISDALAAQYDCFPVQPTDPPTPQVGYKVVRAAPEFVDGAWRERWAEEPYSQAEIDQQWAAVRDERNARLAACDWTQLDDTPLTNTQKQAWAIYRQALRDITAQPDPYNIVWPDMPS